MDAPEGATNAASHIAQTDSGISEDKINALSSEMMESEANEACEDGIQLEEVQIEVKR